MTNLQLYLAIGVPLVFNTVLTLTVYAFLNQRLTDGFAYLNRRIDTLERSVNQRFDDLQRSWFEALLRVEGVLDARLKHLEDR